MELDEDAYERRDQSWICLDDFYIGTCNRAGSPRAQSQALYRDWLCPMP